MDKVELKPCPFCGGDELSHGWDRPGWDGREMTGNVQCHSCDAFVLQDSEAEAITAWNTRPDATTIETLQAQLAARDAELERLNALADEQARYANVKKGECLRLREAGDSALTFACLTLAFIGRDQGTNRIDKTLNGLCGEAVKVEKSLRAALGQGEG